MYFKNDSVSNMAKKLFKILLLIVGIPLGMLLALKLSVYIAPFIIAFLISHAMEPVINFIMKKTRLARKYSALITLLIFLCTVGLLITMLIIKLISELRSAYEMIDQYYAIINQSYTKFMDKASDFYDWLPAELTANLGALLSETTKFIADLLSKFIKGAVTTAISLPQALIFILVTILSTYFLASDRDKIYNVLKSQLPTSWVLKIQTIKNNMFSALFGYIRAQLIIMTITFTELCIGFSVIGISQPMLLALLISIFDALPILGTGGILTPWAAYMLIIGEIRMGISLLVLYLIVLIIRQLIEPRVLGDQIGIHPLVTLIAMYAGLQIFGVVGLIIGPITMLLLKNIISGYLNGKTIAEVLEDKNPES